MTRARHLRRGFSLIELLVVMFGISLVLTMLGVLIWATMRIHTASTDSFERLQQQANLADVFRADVAAARESPELRGDFSGSPVCMMIRDEDGALLIYRWHEGRLERKAMREKGEETVDFPVGGEDTSVAFSRRDRLVTMELQSPNRAPLAIASTLGGNLP